MTRHIWTNEQIKYLKRIANGKPKKVTLEKINKKFNLNLSLKQLNYVYKAFRRMLVSKGE
jgi:hypothetical protein